MINVQFNLMYQRQVNESIQVKIFTAGEFETPVFTALLNTFNVATVKIPTDLIQKGITYTYSGSQSINYHMYPLPTEEINSDIYIYDDWPYPNNLLWRSMLICRLYQRQINFDVSNIYQNNQLNISFSVQVPFLSKNQLVYILGNHEQLGSWNEDNKILLFNTNKSSNLFQSLFITLPNQKTQIKYKYLLMDKITGQTIYEEGPDRTINVIVQTNQLIQSHSFFRYKEFKTPKLFGIKVDLYKFKQKRQFWHIDIYDLVTLIPFCKGAGIKMICPLQIVNDDGFFNTDFIAMGLIDVLSPELLSQIEQSVNMDDYQKHQYLKQNFEDHFEKNILKVNQYLKRFPLLKVYCIYKFLEQQDLCKVDSQKLLQDPDYCDQIYRQFYNENVIKLTFIAYEQIIIYQQIKFVFEQFQKNNISLQLEWPYSREKRTFMENIITFQQFLGIHLETNKEQFLVDYKTNTLIQTNFYVKKRVIDSINLTINPFVSQIFENSADSIILKDFSLYYSCLVRDQYDRVVPLYDVNMKYECLDNIKRYSLVLFQKYQLESYDKSDVDVLMDLKIIAYNEQYQLMELFYNDVPFDKLNKRQLQIFKELFGLNVLIQYDQQTNQYIPHYALQNSKQYTLLKESQKSQLNDYAMKYQHCLQEKKLEYRHKVLTYLCQYESQFIIDDKLNDTYSKPFYDNIFLTNKTHIEHLGDQVLPFSWDFSYYTQIEPYNNSITQLWQNQKVTIQFLKQQLNKLDPDQYYQNIQLCIQNIFEKYLFCSSVINVMYLQDIMLLGQMAYNTEMNALACKDDEDYHQQEYNGNMIFKYSMFILPTQENTDLIQILKTLLQNSKRFD